jgi:hypothetical protein
VNVNVSAAGGGSPSPDPGLVRALDMLSGAREPHSLSSSHSHVKTDSFSASLGELSTPAMLHLLQVVEDHLHTHPAQASRESAGSMMLDARDAAASSVIKAAHAINMGGDRSHAIPNSLDPRNVLALANQFIGTGQVANYLRAEELGRLIVSWYDGPLPAVPFAAERSLNPRFRTSLKKLWRRAPLLGLFIGWLMTGVVAGLFLRILSVPAYKTALPFEVWGVGFLVLVVFQFVVTIRGALQKIIVALGGPGGGERF